MSVVALRKESVDRNRTPHHRKTRPIPSLSARRAWIEITTRTRTPIGCVSLSARRAWIEIDWASVITAMTSVALRKESVDRNIGLHLFNSRFLLSLSARRAWIEIASRWRV